MAETGKLQISLVTSEGARPIPEAKVSISYTGEAGRVLEELTTNESGQTEEISLEAPAKEWSLVPGAVQPYSEYNVRVQKEGMEEIVVSGTQIFAEEQAYLNLSMAKKEKMPYEVLAIGPHTLYGDYPPKVIEPEIKEQNLTGEVVLSRVVVPEYVIVHDGVYNDATAADYYVPYREYIKNVTACEIYATWPRETLRANILAIMSFTLNRVYTEWYRSKGYDFTITSSTAFDQKWIRGKTTYESINRIVDEIFNQYLSRPDVVQPILAQYCDGKTVSCPTQMSQWGSKYLGDDGLSAEEILRFYYGNDIYINQTEMISGVPASYPGAALRVGASGEKVRQMQKELNVIAGAYPAIGKVAVDGIYGPQTEEAVREFQTIFHLTPDGVVGFNTWYKISQIYVGVSKIAELT